MSKRVTIDYTNYKHERKLRNIEPVRILFGSSEWHPEPQWLLRALDIDRGVIREFAIANIHAWRQQ